VRRAASPAFLIHVVEDQYQCASVRQDMRRSQLHSAFLVIYTERLALADCRLPQSRKLT
jgi:hypothetical protein